jgi:hypothetical protein
LAVYTKVVSEHAARLQLDGTYTLISRLAHQVVKAGLRKRTLVTVVYPVTLLIDWAPAQCQIGRVCRG